MRVIDIVAGTTVDGPGLRTSIYFAGCTHNCPGCHNPTTHDPDAGREMSVDDIMAVVNDEGFNVTLSGGDPMQQPVDQLLALLDALHDEGYTVWCYTGYTYESLAADAMRALLLNKIDVLVDGPFIEALRDTQLRFRGSSNQRLLDLSTTPPTPWHD